MVGYLGSTMRALLLATLLSNSYALVAKRQATYSYFGCRTDSVQARVLPAKTTAYDTMTIQSCQADCAGYTYFGTEYGRECWCANTLAATSAVGTEASCSFPCAGNAAQKCGGNDRLSVYKLGPANSSSSSSGSSSGVATTTSRPATTSSTVPTGPGHPAVVGAYTFQGCWTEIAGGRALTDARFDSATMTTQFCATSCAAYTYFGIQYGQECFCGNTINAASTLAPIGDCNFICPGNANQYCGAGNRMELYKKGTTTGSTTTSAVGSTTSRTSAPPVSTTTTTTTVAPQPSGFPTGWASQGCWVDGAAGRILDFKLPDSNTLTLQSCVSGCAAAGYEIAGAEYGVECYCGHVIDNGGVKAAAETECNMNCAGNANQKCGAGGRLSLWSKGTPENRGPQKTNLPAGWTYTGCIQDNIRGSPQPGQPDGNLYTFPYKVWNLQTNTAVLCITRCQEYGFTVAGVEYGEECFCGDPGNIQKAATPNNVANPQLPSFNTRVSVPQLVPEANCNIPCPGNVRYQCGAGNLLSYYTYTGTTAKPFLDKWSFPTGANAGTYTDLIGGKTVPLITGVGINGKVAFVEKGGTGLANGTGAYELDPTMTSNPAAAWREMAKFETDIFCAAGITLPDRKGRQLTVGGWAGDALRGLRLWQPDGSPGVAGKSQWEEDPLNVQIQRPRWYPSALILANGSIAVIGGEIGNNDQAEPTLEILPPTGGGLVYLDFLQRTWPDNLYPFVAVLPSGVFIAYLDEARILNPTTFATIKTLPKVPGSVVNAQSGRTYSLEGAMVLLPQYAPYTANTGVLICGGSTSGAIGGPPGVAIDNCVSTRPEDANPVWTLERMPSKRVLPCIAGLPDGTYLIANGAQHGVAGFGLAASPNLNAVLYDPAKPVNTRMSVMANTSVARLYHSEAIVLLDGRVLITGSDPTGDPAPTAAMFPNEFRVEVFTPPYLLSGIPRPTFTITDKDWAYGHAATFTVAGSTADIRVSLLGSVVSTHGNSMGQRTIFPAVSCAGQTCTVTAPPNSGVAPPGWFMMFVLRGGTPSHGVFVRVGGDPANLGNWPSSSEFTKPGVGPAF